MSFRPVFALNLCVVALSLLAGCAQPGPGPAPAAPGAVAATVGSDNIMLEQVDAQIRRAEPDTWQALFDARQRALGQLIDERLLAAAAAELGTDVETLVADKVHAGVAPVSDEEVAVFFRENEQRMGGQPLQEMAPRIHEFLTDRQLRTARHTYLAQLREQAGVVVLLQAPRVQIEVGADEPAKGPQDAPITLVEYSDFECPYCVRAQSSVAQVLATYGDQVRHVYRDFPLAMHDNAHLAAQAGQCAAEQDQFWAYHDVLFANVRALRPDDLRRYAVELNLDAGAFDECLQSGRHAESVDADLASGQANGVSGTPAFFINGRLLSGAQPFTAFQQIIDEELRSTGL